MTRSAINYKECTLPDFVIYGTVPSKTKNSVHASNTASQSKDISRNSLPVFLKIHIVSNKSHNQQQRFGGWRASQFLYACASEPGETGTSKGKPSCWDLLHAHPSSTHHVQQRPVESQGCAQPTSYPTGPSLSIAFVSAAICLLETAILLFLSQKNQWER